MGMHDDMHVQESAVAKAIREAKAKQKDLVTGEVTQWVVRQVDLLLGRPQGMRIPDDWAVTPSYMAAFKAIPEIEIFETVTGQGQDRETQQNIRLKAHLRGY